MSKQNTASYTRKNNFNINNFVKIMTQFDSKLIAQAKKTKGYLLKKSNTIFSSWKNNYFILLKDSLYLFQDQTLQSQKKAIHFSEILQITSSESYEIEIKTKKKTYFLKADTQEIKDLWIASLNILKQNYFQSIKNPKKSASNSQSRQKYLTSSNKSSEIATEKTKANSSSKKDFQIQKITYLLRQKQLSKFLSLLNLDKLLGVTKEQKFLSRILFVEDRKNGIYFSLSSKSIYPVKDEDLVKEDFIYPYQLNVLYFIPLQVYKNALENKKSAKLIQLCKCSQIIQCSTVDFSILKLQVHCQKPIQIQVKHLSQVYVNGLVECIKMVIQVGRQYWSTKGKLLKNIDKFVQKFEQNDRNELVFYKMVENEFQSVQSQNSKLTSDKRQIEIFFLKVDSLVSNLKNFMDACQIKSPPLSQVKDKFAKLYHKFVYNFLSHSWSLIYKQATDEELIIYSKKVFSYYETLNIAHHDARVRQGCKTLLRIALKNFKNTINQLINNFTNVEEQSLRILKKTQFSEDNDEIVSKPIFFSTFCTNFFSIFTIQFKSLAQIPKSQQFMRMSWISMRQTFKIVFQSLSVIAQNCKERSSLISISNSLRFLKNKRIPELSSDLEKTILWSFKRQRQQFLKELNYEISLVQNFCVKKLFIITFSSIDKQLLKHQIKNMDFQKICTIVIDEIFKLEHILPQVKVAMYESAFQQVCYFLYICTVKFDNKQLSKDQCLSMINQKMTAIKEAFFTKVDQEKIMLLLKDLNLLKQFITCPLNNIKNVTRDLKKVFGSNFTELNLKNLISMRVSALKEKQYLFQECRQEIKSSYNSTQEIESFQRQSFFNSSYRGERKSTLTESIQSYYQYFEKGQPKSKNQKTMLFSFQNSIKEAHLYRKKVIKNFNTSYTKFFYRLKKGKLLEYDNDLCEDILNCYLLSQLKKCYLQPEKKDLIHLQFQKQVLKLKTGNLEQANSWIQKILEAMEQQKSLIGDINQCDPDDGVLFQDLSKKVTFETKQTNEPCSPNEKQKTRNKKNLSPQLSKSRSPPKRSQNISPKFNKKHISPEKLNRGAKKQAVRKKEKTVNKQKESGCGSGCGTGCNFL